MSGTHPNPEGADPAPVPDDETYIRAVRGVLSKENANEQLKRPRRQEGWSAFGFDLNPINLGLIVVFQPFAEWYVRRFPEHAETVREIRSMPEERAFEEIRKGRWVQIQGYPSRG